MSRKDQFFTIDDVHTAIYVGDKTPYTNRKYLNKVFQKLECTSKNIFEWFFNNAMKAKPDKCNFLSSFDMNNKVSVNYFDIEIHIYKNFLV